jgi:hypothetical protein
MDKGVVPLRYRLLAGAAVLLGVPLLVFWATRTDDPTATIAAITTLLAIGMAGVLVVTLLVDGRHFARGGPHRLFFPVTIAGHLLGLASTSSSQFPALPVALLLSLAATVVMWVRIRRNAPPDGVPVAR